MRIGFVSTYPPIECGIATYTQYLVEELKRNSQEIFVVSQIGAKGEKVFPVYWRESVSIAAHVYNLSTRLTPDVMHIQHEFGLFGDHRGVQVIDLILRYKMSGIPIVATLHTVFEKLTLEEEIILRIMVNECDAIIVHEDYQKETLLRYFGKSCEKRIFVIPHGVRNIAPIKDAKKKLDIAGKKVVLMCGYFRSNKQFHKIVEMWPEITSKSRNAILLLAGKSQGMEYADYQRKLFESVNNSPVNDKIMVLRGQFPQHTFDTIVSASDIAVLPYTLGGQSGIMAQYYAFGKPVVSSNLKAFKISMERSKGGLIAKKDQDYIDHISNLLNDNSQRKKLSNNIKEYTQNECFWEKIVPQHLDIYESVVKVPYGKAKYVYFGEK